MAKQKVILLPVLPQLPSELEEFKLSPVDLADWVDVTHNIVVEKNFEGVQKLKIESSRLQGAILSSLNLEKFEVNKTVFERVQLVATHTYKATCAKMIVSDSRATGGDFAEGYFEDCLFKNVKFDEAGFRMARFKRVVFENCVLGRADFYQAKFLHVSFSGCELEETSFDSASCQAVDFRGENLSFIKGVTGLKGATISQEQLIQIAPLLASELGLKVEES